MKRDLYIDFDGVVLDTLTQLYRDAEFYYGPNLTEKEMKDFCSGYNWNKVIVDENIINKSIEAIQLIIDSKKFKSVSILTHINSLKEGVLKINYLRRFFKEVPVILCPKTVSKTKIVHPKGAILIDDFSGNLREWKNEEGIPVKFSAIPEESKEFKVIDNLVRVLEIID